MIFCCIFRFAAQSNSGKHIPNGLIKFDSEQVDPFDVFTPSRGEFKVKTRGLYMFSFDANISNSRNGKVWMYLNGSEKHSFYHNDDDKLARQMHFTVSQLLDVGDVITFQNEYANSIYVSSYRRMTLVVYKIK